MEGWKWLKTSYLSNSGCFLVIREKRFLIFSSQMNVKFLILWFHFRTIKINRIKKKWGISCCEKTWTLNNSRTTKVSAASCKIRASRSFEASIGRWRWKFSQPPFRERRRGYWKKPGSSYGSKIMEIHSFPNWLDRCHRRQAAVRKHLIKKSAFQPEKKAAEGGEEERRPGRMNAA